MTMRPVCLALLLLLAVPACSGGVGGQAATRPSVQATPSTLQGGTPTAAGDGEVTKCEGVSVSRTLRMSASSPLPVVTLAVGEAVRVTAEAPFGTLTAPEAANRDVLCRSSVVLDGTNVSAVFVGQVGGETRVVIVVTGVAAGIRRAVFALEVTVR